MRFINFSAFLVTMAVTSFVSPSLAQSSDEQSYNNQAQAIAEQAKQNIERVKKQMQEQGQLSPFSEEALEQKTRQYQNAAKLIADDSMRQLSGALQQHFNMDASTASSFSASTTNSDAVKGIFISFSMSETDVLESMKAAVRDDAQIFLNGIAAEHQGIHHTIRQLQRIGAELPVKPDIRFRPKYFEQYEITKVPTIIYAAEGKTVMAEGILNIQWLLTKASQVEEDTHFGNYGAVFAVEEPSIIETLKASMASYDWTGKREEAINTFWKKRTFNRLPAATEASTWFIDPTVMVQKDIRNPQGDLLANAGQTINPLISSAAPLSLYIFNPMDIAQLQWVHSRLNTDINSGQVMLLFSEIDAEKGWDHLGALRKHFKRELYQLPEELIQKFDLTSLPVKVSTVQAKGVFKIEQVYLPPVKEGK